MSRSGPLRVFEAVRTGLFWTHLAIGTAAGIVVLLMAATGVALAYQRQLLEGSAGRHRIAEPAAAPRMPLDDLVAAAREGAGDRRITGLTVRADPHMPVSVTLEDRSSLFLHPGTGALLGSDAALRGFFSAVERVHRSIVYRGTTRSETGTAITGAANLGFLLLILSGLVLWWPRRWSGHAFRSVLLFARGARGRARDWNWHHVLGIWSAPALVLIVASAAFISYDWPQRLVERAFGQPAAEERGGRGGERSETAKAAAAASLDTIWARTVESSGPWHSVQLRLPAEPGRPIAVTVSHTAAFRPDQRTSLTFDAAGGALVERRDYAALDPARRFRAWMRPLHTGEVGGIPGQTIAAAVSLAAVVMVCTGLALAWRRLRAALGRRSARYVVSRPAYRPSSSVD